MFSLPIALWRSWYDESAKPIQMKQIYLIDSKHDSLLSKCLLGIAYSLNDSPQLMEIIFDKTLPTTPQIDRCSSTPKQLNGHKTSYSATPIFSFVQLTFLLIIRRSPRRVYAFNWFSYLFANRCTQPILMHIFYAFFRISLLIWTVSRIDSPCEWVIG